ncbi:MAG: secondary thiamine-phosphate synthase enzyme YjbQ [Candidatus Moranbacteria bacterium]|nr:secondary thiamine-phosphate synthase enzyme YjbQ [Candidatus Moranbacteria bacterium]
MKIINHLIKLKTATTLDFIDITDKIKTKLKKAGIKRGVINIQSLHTTMAVLVQEAEPLMISDLKKVLDKIAPRTVKYMHDNFEIRTVNMNPNEPINGHSHCKAAFLPTSCYLNIMKGDLQLGKWQRIFAVELDNARPRQIALQIIGE